MSAEKHSKSTSGSAKHVPFLTVENTVAVYTILKILLEMKKRLGLEAMLEYIEAYRTIIEKANPSLQAAVDQALGLISVDKLYKDITSDE